MSEVFTEHQRVAKRKVLFEVFRHVRLDVAPARFREMFIEQLEQAFGAVAGAIWIRTVEGTILLSDQWNLDSVGLRAGSEEWKQHGKLLFQTFSAGVPRNVLPGSRGNSTSSQILLAPCVLTSRAALIVEVFRPFDRDEQQDVDGDLSLLSNVSEFASGYLRIQELERHSHVLSSQSIREEFLRNLHAAHSSHQVATVLVNDGRAVADCDRVSVFLCEHRRVRIEAVSGQSVIARKSNAVCSMERIAMEVARGGQPIVYTSSGDARRDGVAPLVLDYVAESAAQRLIVAPIRDGAQGAVLGVLMMEWFDNRNLAGDVREIASLVTVHGAIALRSAREREQIFLRGLRQRIAGLIRGVLRWRTLLATATVVAVCVGLATIPGELKVEAKGYLRAMERRGLFATENGIIKEIMVEHGQHVQSGQVLAKLENPDLQAERDHNQAQLLESRERLALREAARNDRRLSSLEQLRLDGEIAELRETMSYLARRVERLDSRIQSLIIRAPMDGHIVTWNPVQRLTGRPVAQGSLLLEITNEDGPWQLELRVAESQTGYMLQSRFREQSGSLLVDYVLATQPELRYRGTLSRVARRTETQPEQHSLLVTVAPDSASQVLQYDGAEVHARILCGRRPLGFVWFRDAIAFVQTRLMF